ncbi:MAG: ParB N-terminal domain-containing protein [Acidobacteriales bacterium]|nr:ParB N-terminal domain-containing protein [Terriglobales bacterium]
MNIRTIPISKINPAVYNPRKDLQPSDPEYQKLLKSIDEFGCVEPLVWNKKTGNLVGGHQRFKILVAKGAKQVQVSVVNLPLKKEQALNIALNKISGEWDEQKLAELLDELAKTPDFDIAITGFDAPEVEDLLARVLQTDSDNGKDDSFDVDAALDLSRSAVTKGGQLVELGRHRLLCGDSTDPLQVQKVMDGKRAALFATDPPYLVNYDGTNHPGKRRAKKDKNKNWSGTYGITWDDAAANPDLYEKFIKVAVEHAILPAAAWYCWHASRRQAMVESVWEKFGAFVHQQIIWVKDRPILTRSWYTWQHEPCFFGWVRPRKPARHAQDYPSTIWQIPTVPVGKPTEHPTSKPVELFAIPMRQHTRRGDICYEPFCGSGSQLIAAEKLGRRCYAIEISPHYCDVIVRRWIDYVGIGKAPPEMVKRYAQTRKEAA